MFDACLCCRKFILQPLLLGVCFSCLAIAEDTPVPPPKSNAAELKPLTIDVAGKAIDAEKLRNLLAPHGWRVEPDGQVGVLLYPRATEPPKATSGEASDAGVTSSFPLGQGFSADDMETLRAMLSPHGWRVEADGAGGVLLYPRAAQLSKVRPTVESDPAISSIVPLGQGFTTEDINRLRGMLTPHGWRVEADGVGGVLLYPRPVETPSLQQEGSSKGSSPTLTSRPGFTPRDIAHLRELLSPHGWRVEADGEGGVLLYPGAFAVHSAPRTASTQQAPSGITSIKGFASGDLEILRSLLTPHGWRVKGDSQGGILLIPHPPVAQELVAPYVAARSWSGVILPALQKGTVRLPLDSWEKAHQLTLSWIELSGKDDLLPGKIRNINKVYLVSVVSRIPPHVLRHQLVFREDDGHMFLVY